MEQINPVTKSDVTEYIASKDYLRVEEAGRFFKCRIGERSHIDGIYTTKVKADAALRKHVGTVLYKSRQQIAKREANKNAKKNKS